MSVSTCVLAHLLAARPRWMHHDLVSFWTYFQGDCPQAKHHRPPEGPCEDIGQCGLCGAITFDMRPEGETFGFHESDCSLALVHEGQCAGGGSGHPPGHVRGFWRGFEDDVARERARWGLPVEEG